MNKLFRFVLGLILLCSSSGVFTQITNTATLDTTGGQQIGNTSIGAYLDTYFGYAFNEPFQKQIPFFVSSARHNELNINLAFIDFRYKSDNLRARVVPAFGTFMTSNYSSEPGSMKYLLEANGGFRISNKKNIWMDLGILGSPYTNESAISKDHLMYTRSLAPEFVPYYLCGIKTTFPLNEKLNFYLYLINGWQQIYDVNNGKSVGTQLEYRPNNNNLINWNTYVGDERVNSIFSSSTNNRMRYFSDIYWLYNAGKKWAFTSCIYAGMQDVKQINGDLKSFYWGQINFISSFSFTDMISLAGRVEYFYDPNQLMISTYGSSFQGGSAGLCLNVKPNEHALIRLDGRYFLNDADFYLDKDATLHNSFSWVTASATLWF